MTIALVILAFSLGYAIGCVRTNAVAVNAYEVAAKTLNDLSRQKELADNDRREATSAAFTERRRAKTYRDALWAIGWGGIDTTYDTPGDRARATLRRFEENLR